MTLLIYLTIAYTVVLVVALAVSLIAIAYFLNRARVNLRKISAGLTQVNNNVQPLEAVLTAANGGLIAVRDHLGKVQSNLAEVANPVVAGPNH